MTVPPELMQRAIEECRRHVESALEGEFLVEPVASHESWDRIALRRRAKIDMVIWRAFAEVEVLLDEEDRPVGYVDPEKWTDCAWEPVSTADAERWVRDTGLVPTGMRLDSAARGEKDCLELVFRSDEQGIRSVRARVNPRRKAIISVVPEGVSP